MSLSLDDQCIQGHRAAGPDYERVDVELGDDVGEVLGERKEVEGATVALSVDLPPPFGALRIDSWKGNSQSTGNAGSKKYNFPKLVPAGVEFKVEGSHTDENGFCTGYVNLKIDGGPFDSPLAPVSLVATVASGAGLFGVIRPLLKKVVAA